MCYDWMQHNTSVSLRIRVSERSKMFQKVLKKIHISQACRSKSQASQKKCVESSDQQKQDVGSVVQTSLFLDLPIDILNLILQELTLFDIISLSLTTKYLRYISLSFSSDIDLNTGPVRVCSRLIYHRLFPSTPDSAYNCPYCMHKLCPPTCSSALILETSTGIFFPPSLFPVHKAVFYWASQSGSYQSHEYPLCSKKPNKIIHDCNRNSYSSRRYYSTIWCEHHRCPRDLVGKTNSKRYSGRRGGWGRERFLHEYNQPKKWRDVRLMKNPEYMLGVNSRWLVGYKPVSQNASDAKSTTLDPVYEKFFYDIMCLHCFLPLPKERDSYRPWFGSACECSADDPPEAKVKNGCRICRVISFKVQCVEAFDNTLESNVYDGTGEFKAGRYWLYIALPCKLIRNPDWGKGIAGEPPQRLLTVPSVYSHVAPLPDLIIQNYHKEAIKSIMDVMRGYNLLPFSASNSPNAVMNLPRSILGQILTLLRKTPKCHIYFARAEMASYAFGYGTASNRPDKARRYHLTRVRDPWGRRYDFNRGSFYNLMMHY